MSLLGTSHIGSLLGYNILGACKGYYCSSAGTGRFGITHIWVLCSGHLYMHIADRYLSGLLLYPLSSASGMIKAHFTPRGLTCPLIAEYLHYCNLSWRKGVPSSSDPALHTLFECPLRESCPTSDSAVCLGWQLTCFLLFSKSHEWWRAAVPWCATVLCSVLSKL